jgi:hypothetical protein
MTDAKLSIENETMRNLVSEIARALVDESDAVHVQVSEENGITTLNLRVASLDIGKMIGKQGRTARSLRCIVSAVGMKLRHRYSLNIHEDCPPAI